jgi:hypothetical protein
MLVLISIRSLQPVPESSCPTKINFTLSSIVVPTPIFHLHFPKVTSRSQMVHAHEHGGVSHAHPGGDHGHTHEVLDGPGSYLGREMPIVEGRDWRERAFTIGIGGYGLHVRQLTKWQG